MLSAIRDNFPIYFPIWMTFYFSLSGMARTPKTMFNRSDEQGCSCLAPDITGDAFTFLPLWLLLYIYDYFIYVIAHL